DSRIERRSDAAELRRRLVRIRRIEHHVIEDVEKLGAKLQGNTFHNVGTLGGAEIRVEVMRSTNDVLAGIAERSNGIGHEHRGVEVLRDQSAVRTARIERGIASDVVGAVAVDSGKRVVPAAGDRKRKAALQGQDAVKHPTVHKLSSDAFNRGV